MRKVSFHLALLVIITGCSGVQSPSTAPTDVVLELDVFSGRPNPSWVLSAPEASALAEHLGRAVSQGGTSLPGQRLGFRGFSVRNPDGDGGIDETLYITAAGELVDQVNGSVYAHSPEAAAYLREIARAHGYGEILDN